MKKKLPLCKCGCLKRTTEPGTRFLRGHFNPHIQIEVEKVLPKVKKSKKKSKKKAKKK